MLEHRNCTDSEMTTPRAQRELRTFPSPRRRFHPFFIESARFDRNFQQQRDLT